MRRLALGLTLLALAPATAGASSPRPTDATLESVSYALSDVAQTLAEHRYTEDGERAYEWEVDACRPDECALRLNDVAARVVACRWLTRRRGRCLVRFRLDTGERCETKIGVRDRLRWAYLQRPNGCTRLAAELGR